MIAREREKGGEREREREGGGRKRERERGEMKRNEIFGDGEGGGRKGGLGRGVWLFLNIYVLDK